jgi:hypothetical protein
VLAEVAEEFEGEDRLFPVWPALGETCQRLKNLYRLMA